MNYLLTVLTNGRRVCLERTLASYLKHLEPLPRHIYVMDDGGQTGEEFTVALLDSLLPGFQGGLSYDCSPMPLGQCGAQARCWQRAAASDLPWVFHIEDDSVLLRPLELAHLAEVLDAEPTVAQMALVRCPWGMEIEHGGYIPMFPGLYERRYTNFQDSSEDGDWFNRREEWIATTRNWAHAPALIRTGLCRSLEFPAQPGCETEIGPLLLARDPAAVFGLWGWGEPWVAHIGVERAPGAHGY